MYGLTHFMGWLSCTLFWLCLVGCGQPISQQANEGIHWTKLPDLPSGTHAPSLGVSAAFAGVHEGVLLVAGGCNFPEKPAAEGGVKRYYSEIFALLPTGWQCVGQLPHPVAYGAAVSTPEGVVCVGGNHSDASLAEVLRLSYDQQKREVTISALPSLPSPMDNLAAAYVCGQLYVAGGNRVGEPTHTFLSLDLNQTDKGWQSLPDFPGAARVQPVMAAVQGQSGARVYLAGGFQPIIGEQAPIIPTDVLVYDPASAKWSKESEFPPLKEGGQRTLTGGCALTDSGNRILFLGGVNYDRFLAAIARPLRLRQAEAAQDTALVTQLQAEAKDYLLHPVDWYRFNKTLLLYDPATQTWQEGGTYEPLARAGASAVLMNDRLIVINGELKPGIRTPQVNQGIMTTSTQLP